MATGSPLSGKRTIPATQKFAVYDTQAYYGRLIKRLRRANAGDRIVLVMLWLQPDRPVISDVFEAACGAARRGADVLLIVDAFMFLVKRGVAFGPAFYLGQSRTTLTKTFRARLEALEKLRAAGGRFAISNQPRHALVNPFRGRSHMKFTVINDEVFVGGCNLDNAQKLDLMIGWRDRWLANWLSDLAEKIVTTGNVATALGEKDVRLPIDQKTSLLIDTGVAHQSVILDTAKQLIAHAKKRLLITYQYYPQATAAQSLRAAHDRGVDLQIYYNHHTKHTKPLNYVFAMTAWSNRRNQPASFVSHRLSPQHSYLHAKVVATENAVLVGSHNYMPSGVKLGTAEIALLSHDKTFTARVVETLQRQLGS